MRWNRFAPPPLLLRRLHHQGRSLIQRGSMPKRRRREGTNWQRKNKKVGSEQNESTTESGVRGAGYEPIIKENNRFVKYYQGQGVIPEEEWEDFMSILKRPLPVTFRITGTQHVAMAVRECLQQTFFVELIKAVQGVEGQEGEELAPPTPLPWYPNQLAWQVPLSRAFIRKSPEVSKFHRFLVDESDQGNISRQEAVSMIPPLLLDVQPHHRVLDMCAAPGSKTAQLIEMIHADDGKMSSSSIPTGVVVANDADNKRCYMLVHQAKRLKSPCFMVTNHDASIFPMLYYNNEEGVRCPLYYDRILCDVPCSGDGTMRKNPTIWRSWSPSLGVGLHRLQLRILNRGLELLQSGGRLVYSTCSLNPVENEAVISTILQLCKGTVELVDVSDQLPGLRTIPGLTSWKVMNKKMEWVTEASTTSTSSTCFPPDPSFLPQLNLHRCLRVLPHHQDTGGFFIAVLHKVDWLPWQRKPSTTFSSSSSNATSGSSSSSITTTSSAVNETKEEISAEKKTMKERPSVLAPHETGEGGGGGGGETERVCIQQEEQEEGGNGCVESLEATEEEEEGKDGIEDTNGPLRKGEGDEEEGGAGGEEGKEAVEKPKSSTERPGHNILGKPGHRQGKKGRIYREDPYVFLPPDSEILKVIKPYYGLGEEFPCGQLLTRSVGGKKRNIYLTSRLVKDLLQRNELHVKFINVGVKVLARCDNNSSSCPFRLYQEGIDSLVPFITNNRVPLTLDDLVLVLKEPNPLSVGLAPETQSVLSSLEQRVGPGLFEHKPPDPSNENMKTVYNHPIHLSGWVARKSVRLYVDKKYRCHFLAMLGHDPPQTMSLASVSGRRGDDSDIMEEGGKEETKVGGKEETKEEMEEGEKEEMKEEMKVGEKEEMEEGEKEMEEGEKVVKMEDRGEGDNRVEKEFGEQEEEREAKEPATDPVDSSDQDSNT